jgi:hypothetical protein
MLNSTIIRQYMPALLILKRPSIQFGTMAFSINYSRLPKMNAKALTCFNFFNFRPVSTKFTINIKNVILTNRMVFVFRIATFLAGK